MHETAASTFPARPNQNLNPVAAWVVLAAGGLVIVAVTGQEPVRADLLTVGQESANVGRVAEFAGRVNPGVD